MQKLSFVIPCYRSEEVISPVIQEIADWMQGHIRWDWEIIAVNDCSPDQVGRVLNAFADKEPRLKVIELAKNGGKHAAVMAGYHYVTGDVIINLDDDGQCPLDQLDLLLDAINQGADIAIARYPQKKQSAFKNFGSLVNEWMSIWLIDQPKDMQFSNFSVLRRFVVDEVLRYNNPYPYLSGLFFRSTAHIVNVTMEERDRISGQGSYTFRKSLSMWMNGFTAFSVKPLRLATMAGLLFSAFGFLFGAYTIVCKILNPEMLAGYSSMMAALMFIGGMIMMMLGLIGEYIGRIYISINNSPQYVIRATRNLDLPDGNTAGQPVGK